MYLYTCLQGMHLQLCLREMHVCTCLFVCVCVRNACKDVVVSVACTDVHFMNASEGVFKEMHQN
jgi:hypothetical protein